MKSTKSITTILVIFFCSIIFLNFNSSAQPHGETIKIKGLNKIVEIFTDIWGISHIFAKDQDDLFFAQGFNVAHDRLFQLEVWRRQATGTMAEILGERALQNDIGARLFKFRGPMENELNHYHPNGKEIINSFVKGINAYIDLTRKNPALLPIEFKLLGIKPHHWTPDVVVSRHNGLYRNVTREISLARQVQSLGEEKVKQLNNFEPGDPPLRLSDKIDVSLIPENVLNLYRARRTVPQFRPEDIVDAANRNEASVSLLNDKFEFDSPIEQGSNNWVVNGSKTFSRFPIMANDPHRTQQIPSLRYFAHLVAPGWNVIGGGEPALPGLSIGHNEHGAWGLTIFSVDQEDLYIYKTNPQNPNQYRYKNQWKDMTIIKETIPVKGKKPVTVELKYTHHGPVVFEDGKNHLAYAVRASWLEVGAAPYLASLRMDQAKTWEEFREACSYSCTPSENMVWADKNGNIGWQAVGITPVRKNWFGLLPVPGNGEYEWQGFLPIKELPHRFNPPEGYIATANENNVPYNFPVRLGFSWAEPFRVNRIKEVLESGKKFTIPDMMQLQQDQLSIPARILVPLLRKLTPENGLVKQAQNELLSWDFVMDKNSVAPTIYYLFESHLRTNAGKLLRKAMQLPFTPRIPVTKLIQMLHAPGANFGKQPLIARDSLLLISLKQAVETAQRRLGTEMGKWTYGQEKMHYIKLYHLLSRAVNEELRAKLDLPALPRGGSRHTVNNTGSGNQRSGASFRIIADTGNWDNSAGTNNPGQSGNPDSPHYADLYKMWANGDYFPLLFSRAKIEKAAERVTILQSK